MKNKNNDYIFINKTLFFPEKGILAIGDLHLGYEYQIQQSGVLIPEYQIKEVIEELKIVFDEIKEKKFKLKKIIFIGDIKHSFSYEWKEKNYFREVINFLKDYVKEKEIILIKGNHDTIDYSFSDKLQDYYIEDDLAFCHGHKSFIEIFDKKIKTIIFGHIHPSIILSDSQNIKREKYKCFLVGTFNRKKIIILPSFLATIEGTTINELSEGYEDYFSIIPRKKLMNFEVFAIEKNEVYDFGKIKNLT
ncbi:MAG: metallophosphoesterase [Candidatus Pacearchaeota archaeon]|nr:metallophosphoesterase [Candidatus Pacearchaeota archaeon]